MHISGLLRPDRAGQFDPLVSHVARGGVDLEPFEGLGRFDLVLHYLFSALLGRGRVQPFPGQCWRERYGPRVVDVHGRKPMCYLVES